MRPTLSAAMWYQLRRLEIPVAVCVAILGYWRLTHSLGGIFFTWGLVTAGAFYWVRLKDRMIYGSIEIIFGFSNLYQAQPVITGDFAAADFASSDFLTSSIKLSILQALASIYIIVRGLDNFTQGVRKHPVIKLALSLWLYVWPRLPAPPSSGPGTPPVNTLRPPPKSLP